MRKDLVILSLSLALALPGAVEAASYNYTNSDGIWYYTTNSGTATIVGYTGSAGNVVIPDTVNGGLPVSGLGGLARASFTSVTIPIGITWINDGAFDSCANLRSITIPVGIQSIGNGTFEHCTMLSAVSLPEGLLSIGDSAFYNCHMTNLALPGTVQSIGNSAFYNCANLAAISIPDSVVSLQTSAFGYCYRLTNVTIGSGLKRIGDWAFQHCTNLTTVNIPGTVQEIGSDAFTACSGLIAITISTGVLNIEQAAFSWCTSLTRVILPAGLTNIGHGAFESCSSLKAAYFLGNAPPDLASDPAFANDSLATVYYLPGTTGWGPTFGGRPTRLWNPQAVSPGVSGGQFRFTITGPTNAAIVVVACANLSNPVWVPISTNTLTAGTSSFSDPQWANYPMRFYRFSVQ